VFTFLTGSHGKLRPNTEGNPTATGPSYSQLLQEFLPNFYGTAAAPFIREYITLMTTSAKEHGVIGPRKWEGRTASIFASVCQAYLTPEVIIRAGALVDAATAAAAAASNPHSRFTNRTVRVFGRNLHAGCHSHTPARLKLLHACDQWYSSRGSTPLTVIAVQFHQTR
jgi:hypothetical protein